MLREFSPVFLDELSGILLQDRYEEKYILPVEFYKVLLKDMLSHYRILEVDGTRSYHYYTVYYDTPDLAMYTAHQNGKKDRYKIRFRKYLHSGRVFLEIKHKTNKGRTVKKQLRRDNIEEVLSEESKAFIARYSPYNPDTLKQVTGVDFFRITMTDTDAEERSTFDFHLKYIEDGREVFLPELGILEIKHPFRKHHSIVGSLLAGYHIKPTRFSKYCTGILMFHPHVKYNRFKPLLLTLNKLHHDSLFTLIG